MPDIEVLKRQKRWREQERAQERKLARFHPVTGRLLPKDSRNRLISDDALAREPIGKHGAELWITYTPGREEFLRVRRLYPELDSTLKFCDPDALNGYVAFPKRHAPRLPMDIGNIVQYIPVHGGVSYAHKDATAAVWGFDTMHAGSEDVPRTDRDWMRHQCHILHHGLEIAAGLWPEFRRAGQARRIEMAQGLFDIDPAAEGGLDKRLGFQALVNLMCGRIG
jgi:hypothetical protein